MAKYDTVGKMMEFERGLLPKKEAVELFQHLIDSGIVWNLQGHYGRVAETLLKSGQCRTAA
jgi:hypothetical protein